MHSFAVNPGPIGGSSLTKSELSGPHKHLSVDIHPIFLIITTPKKKKNESSIGPISNISSISSEVSGVDPIDPGQSCTIPGVFRSPAPHMAPEPPRSPAAPAPSARKPGMPRPGRHGPMGQLSAIGSPGWCDTGWYPWLKHVTTTRIIRSCDIK